MYITTNVSVDCIVSSTYDHVCRDKEHLGKRRSSHTHPPLWLPFRYAPLLVLFLLNPTIVRSRSHGLVHGVFLHLFGCCETGIHHDSPRFPLCWCDRRHFAPVGHFVRASTKTNVAASLFANKVLLSPSSHSSLADSSVEWAYAFDVHTNSFFPFYLTLYVAQLILLPIITKDKWVCLLVGNTLYLAG